VKELTVAGRKKQPTAQLSGGRTTKGSYLKKYATLVLEYQYAVLRIHDILVWIRIRGSMPLTNGSGAFYFHH
jgi:hypothetical protein